MTIESKSFLVHAVLCSLCIFLVEQVYFRFSYAAPFLKGGVNQILFFLQGCGLSLILATLLIAVAGTSHYLSRFFARWAVTSRVKAGIFAQALFLVLVALAITNAGADGLRSPAPIWQSLFALLPGVVFYFCARRIARGDGERFNGHVLLALVLATWFLSTYWNYFLFGGFGFTHQRATMRSVVGLIIPIVLLSSVSLFSQRQLLLAHRRRFTVFVAFSSLLAIVLLQHINNSYYVDDYQEVNAILIVLSYLLSWHFVSALVPAVTRRIHARTSIVAAILGALTVVSLIGVQWAAPLSSVGYVGAVHTVQQRFMLETIQNTRLLHHSLRGTVNTVRRGLARRSAGSFPIDQTGSLPTTFVPIELSQGVDRGEYENVVLFFLDMKRPHDLGLYNSGQAITPRIDKCFKDAFVFRNAFSAGNNTKVSFPSIYTGTYGATRAQDSRGVVELPYWFAYEKGNNLQTTFSRHGLSTTVLTDAWYDGDFFSNAASAAEKKPIYDGFDRRVVADEKHSPQTTRDLQTTYKEAGGIVPKEKGFLIAVHIYSHELAYIDEVDEMVGMICDEIAASGFQDNTIMLLTSDHGVQFREHGRTSYRHTLFNEEIRVPLLVRIPGMSGHDIMDPVSSVDHLPTLVDLFGYKVDFMVEGRSYLPALFGHALPSGRPLFTETRFEYHSTAVILDDYKLIFWATPRVYALFDLKNDPGEKITLTDSKTHTARLTMMKSLLDGFLAERDEVFWRP
ncbi:MAG: sulfatase-like hydrolase/transferase [Bradymonadaceae bacterium]|nr:sulfatase-like hydrolase/transferase [Lujinxingiaceae bacterium]